MNIKIHRDKRRDIYDWCDADIKSIKTVYVHEPIPIGDHYHQNKDEYFMLVAGKFITLQIDDLTFHDVEAPFNISIMRGQYHKFVCEAGSILICGATHPFDQNDEIRNE